ncbi:MAG TPA: NAD(P)/FAD-dependent oxidoreductase [Myxococcaceae bacterium]|nr:NAD(P)/FAD-dependent oxidoreductase [Myxococcaceae bacterium]
MFEVDVLVAGGGPAGCTTAAAMAQLGMRTLLADAGQDRKKQLAGELLHPVGVEELTAFGFSEVLRSGGAPIIGFAVIDNERTALLPYGPGNRGLGIEHHALITPLLDIVEKRGDVEVRRKTRVSLLSDGPDGVEVSLSHDGRSERVRARMLVAADGRASPLRRALGIIEHHQRLSTMVGVLVDASKLPHAGRGHLFIGGPAPVLAYPISDTVARVMVDLPLGSTPDRVRTEPDILSGVPEPLRQDVLDALQREPPLVASNDTRIMDHVYQGHVVLVGDAAGCCHPLSASGMASAVRDARVLHRAMAEAGNDVPLALAAYARARRPANRTRIALASALYEAFCSDSGEMAALRSGLFRYWERSPTGTRISMMLLSTRETRMSVMAREYARVVAHGLVALGAGGVRAVRGPGRAVRAGALLVASALPHLRTAMAGAVEDRILALPSHVPAAAEPLAPSRASPSRS